jgi:hypothetical protein
MDMSLFEVVPPQQHLFPVSFAKASRLATKILKSAHHKRIFTELWPGKKSPTHINPHQLNGLLSKTGIFRCDRIRVLDTVDSRPCAQRETGPLKVNFHPMLLLEMLDREREAVEQSPSLLDKLEFAKEQMIGNEAIAVCDDGQMAVDGTEDNSRPMSGASKVHHKHTLPDHTQTMMSLKRSVWEREAGAKGEAADMPVSEVNLELKGTKRDSALIRGRTDATSLAVKGAKLVEGSVPSTMTVEQKNVLFLTVLLVHEAQHLLICTLSDALQNGNTPPKKFLRDDADYFTDVGHYLERALYGYSINHVPSAHSMTPFGVDEVIGGLLQHSKLEYILQPSPRFLALLDNPDCKEDIEEDDLKLETTEEQEYVPPRRSASRGRRLEVLHSLRRCPSSSSSDGSQEEEEDEELERLYPAPTITRGKA